MIVDAPIRWSSQHFRNMSFVLAFVMLEQFDFHGI